jgi:RND family efflux transporter MFP subunit
MRFGLFHTLKAIGFVAFAGLALAGCGAESKGSEHRAELRPVLAAPVHYAPQWQAREFVATIKPRIEVDHAFRVTGKVVRRFVEVGQRVKKGDVLATLDEADLRSQKEQAEAELAASRMALEQASADERRAIKLNKDGWTAKAALDRQRTAAEEARGRYQRASRALDIAKNALEYATLRADGNGIVTQTSVEPGQVVAAGQGVVRVARSGELEAAVALPEAFAASASAGEARLFLWSEPSKTYRAKLRELSPSADAMTRTFAARFSLPDADSAIAIGMTATLTIENKDATPAVNVPLAALFNQGQGPSLWKVDDEGRLTLTPVTVLRYEARTALVTGGVAEGDNIVVLGVQKLDAHQRVRVVKQEIF